MILAGFDPIPHLRRRELPMAPTAEESQLLRPIRQRLAWHIGFFIPTQQRGRRVEHSDVPHPLQQLLIRSKLSHAFMVLGNRPSVHCLML
jgi:hypothetical protein